MKDMIEIKKVWQDDDFFELKITCISDIISATVKIYTSDDGIDELSDKIQDFLYGGVNECLWESGTKGDDSTASISMAFLHKDKVGHIQIEVYMELDDGGEFSRHNCCFYVNTEFGLLARFNEKLYKIKYKQLGISLVLNDDADNAI